MCRCGTGVIGWGPWDAGVNGRENVIVPQLIASGNFGRVGQISVNGQVYAHPIIAPNVRIGDASINGVIIATQQNYVSALPL
jgi:hypothetical protein